MEYIQEGNGEYLILVHGALTDGSMWLEHIEHLKSDFDVISVTLRNFNESDIEGFGLNTHADDLSALIQELTKIKPVNIVGWSYGADVILNALAKNDLPISKTVVYEPGFPGCLQEQDMSTWQSDANNMFGPVFEHFSVGNLNMAVESLIDGSSNKKGYFKYQKKEVQELQLAKKNTLKNQLNQQEEPAISQTSISKIQHKVVLSYGQNTRDIFKLVTVATAKLIKSSELKIIPNENHMLPQEKAEKFSNFIHKELSQEG